MLLTFTMNKEKTIDLIYVLGFNFVFGVFYNEHENLICV